MPMNDSPSLTALAERLLPKIDFVGREGGKQSLYVIEMGRDDLLEHLNRGAASEGRGNQYPVVAMGEDADASCGL